MTRTEMILYATPEGELAEQCLRFFETLGESGRGTTAQTYPPHVSLTGFFRREPAALERTIADVSAVTNASTGGSVTVDSLTETNDWLGLDISSEWLSSVAASFADRHHLDRGDDAVRVKDGLHLSLAYGELPAALTIAELADLARSTISIDAEVRWKVGLWERQGSLWTHHP